MNPTLNKPVRSRMWACPHCSGPDCKPCLAPRHKLCVCISYSASGETGQQAQAELYTRTCLLAPGGWSGSGWVLGKDCGWILNAHVPSAHVLKCYNMQQGVDKAGLALLPILTVALFNIHYILHGSNCKDTSFLYLKCRNHLKVY